MSEKETNIQYIPVQPIQPECHEDEIDLKDIIKTLLSYKRFILITTFIITFLASIYAYMKTPIYQIETDIQIGSINNGDNKLYLLDPQATIVYIKNNFLKVTISLVKKSKDILHISIQDISNLKAKKNLQNIFSLLHKKENNKISFYVKSINSQIKLLRKQQKIYQHEIQNLNKKLNNIKNSTIYQVTLETISNLYTKLFEIEQNINILKTNISPLHINKIHIIGNIKEKSYPIKPKKKLIIIVAFITGFILSIFLVFFIEFIKNFKNEEEQSKI